MGSHGNLLSIADVIIVLLYIYNIIILLLLCYDVFQAYRNFQ